MDMMQKYCVYTKIISFLCIIYKLFIKIFAVIFCLSAKLYCTTAKKCDKMRTE